MVEVVVFNGPWMEKTHRELAKNGYTSMAQIELAMKDIMDNTARKQLGSNVSWKYCLKNNTFTYRRA